MLGHTIKQLRTGRGWAQRELARRAGVAQSLISSIENDPEANPTQGTLERIAQTFGLSRLQLLQKAEDTPPPDTEQAPEELFRAVYPAERVERILARWDHLTVAARLELISIAEDLKRRLDEGSQRADAVLHQYPALLSAALDK